jgi:hypothetical protein
MMQAINGISDSLVPLEVHDNGLARSVRIVLTSSEEDKSALLVCSSDYFFSLKRLFLSFLYGVPLLNWYVRYLNNILTLKYGSFM